MREQPNQYTSLVPRFMRNREVVAANKPALSEVEWTL
jgi:hypothetical protein